MQGSIRNLFGLLSGLVIMFALLIVPTRFVGAVEISDKVVKLMGQMQETNRLFGGELSALTRREEALAREVDALAVQCEREEEPYHRIKLKADLLEKLSRLNQVSRDRLSLQLRAVGSLSGQLKTLERTLKESELDRLPEPLPDFQAKMGPHLAVFSRTLETLSRVLGETPAVRQARQLTITSALSWSMTAPGGSVKTLNQLGRYRESLDNAYASMITAHTVLVRERETLKQQTLLNLIRLTLTQVNHGVLSNDMFQGVRDLTASVLNRQKALGVVMKDDLPDPAPSSPEAEEGEGTVWRRLLEGRAFESTP